MASPKRQYRYYLSRYLSLDSKRIECQHAEAVQIFGQQFVKAAEINASETGADISGRDGCGILEVTVEDSV